MTSSVETSAHYVDFVRTARDLGLSIDGALTGADQPNVVAASSATRDVVLKAPRGSDDIYGEARAMTHLHARGLSPRSELHGEILVIDRVRPGATMGAVWESCANNRESVKDHLEDTRALIEAMAEIGADGITLAVEDLLVRDVARSLGGHGDTTASVLNPAVVTETLADLGKLSVVSGPATLCHGDLRAENILWDGTHWVLIDPRAVCGDPCADVGRMAACVAMGPGWALAEAIEVLCAGTALGPERSMVWARAWLLQMLGHHWRYVAQSGHGLARHIELLTA